MVDEGLLRPRGTCQYGFWALTDAGWKVAEDLLS